MIDSAPNGLPVAVFVCGVLGLLVVGGLWSLIEPVVAPRLAVLFTELSEVEVRPPVAVCAAVRRVVGWLIRRACRVVEGSDILFRIVCRFRYRREVCSGVTAFEEWGGEIASIPDCAARAVLYREIERYRPSGKHIWRSRFLAGRNCEKVYLWEMNRRAEAKKARVK